MICKDCREQVHEKCPGYKLCDCQHRVITDPFEQRMDEADEVMYLVEKRRDRN